MASLGVLTNPKLRSQTTAQDKQTALDQFIQAYKIYDSIGFFDLNGNVLVQSTGKPLSNHKDRSYFQATLQTNGATLSQPITSKSSGDSAIYSASPVKDSVTGKTIGIIRARIPMKYLRDVILAAGTENNYLLDDQGNIFAASNQKEQDAILNLEAKTQPASDRFDIYPTLKQSKQTTTKIAQDLLVSYVPFSDFKDEFRAQLPNLGWSTITTQDKQLVFAPQRQLGQVFILGTGVVALGVGAIAFLLANRILRPLLAAANAVQEIGQGNLDTRLQITGADEIAQLGNNINRMAIKLADFVQIQSLLTQQSEALKNLTLQLAIAVEPSEILQLAVQASYEILPANRIIYYQFLNATAGEVLTECISGNLPTTQNTDILNSDLVAKYFTQHQEGKLQVEIINNLTEANLSPSEQKQLESLQVQASLIAPVVVENKLDGLLIAHQCSTSRSWLDGEIDFISQVANQITFAVTRLEFLKQQKLGEIKEKAAKEAIQSRALELLKEVYSVSEGDLTIRAKVTEDEIGTIADSYNNTIESLQKLLNQAKGAVIEVQTNTVANDLAVQALAKEAVVQAEEIAQILQQVKAMEQSSNQVALNASQAEDFVKQASITIDSSDKAMNQTVSEINAVKVTVTETALKAQKLGESSQSISQVINLISRFAAQTHLLALKASIEAARAGEEGKGFAVIADEVRSLASQSAEATAEIETLVSKIQLDTNEVVEAMNRGTEQIAAGNELVQQTRQSLLQVSQASHEISKLVGAITQAAELQSETSAQVSHTMINVAAIANNNSQSATQVFTSIRELSAIAEKLQSGIGKFKT
jgi:methyl-accepting chemotaxis protein PixJ